MKMDLRKFKKISETKDVTTLMHPEGHKIDIAHKSVEPAMRGRLKAMPMFADGGMVSQQQGGPEVARKESYFEDGGGVDAYGGKVTPKASPSGSPSLDPKKAEEMQKGGTSGSTSASDAWSNLKSGLGFARGGKVPAKGDIGPDGEPRMQQIQEDMPSHLVSEAPMPKAQDRKPADAKKDVQYFANGEDVKPEANSTPAPAAQAPVVINLGQPQMPSSALNPNAGQQFAQQQEASGQPQPASGQAALSADNLPYGVTPQMMQGQAPQQASQTPATMQPQQQAAAMAPAAGGQDQLGLGARSSMGATGMANELAGVQGMAKVEGQQANAEYAAAKEQAAHEQELMKNFNGQLQNVEADRVKFQTDVENGHINPDHFLQNRSTGSKVASAIGLILGGIGGGITHSDNPALTFLNTQIANDIDAQKAELGSKESLLSANMKQYGDLHTAMAATRMQMADYYAAKMKMAAASSGSAMAKARSDLATGQLQQKYAPEAQQVALRQTLQQGVASGQPMKIDPAQLVPQMVPKEHQAKVFGEIEAAQNTKNMGNSILKAFEDAANENTIMKTGAGLLRTPASVYALHQAMQPTFKDLEGTVRQAAMDNTFKNITPAPGDSDHTIQQKRTALSEYLQSKVSAPTAKGYGIDLGKFDSTAPQQEAPQVRTMNGANYVKVPGGWKRQ